MSLLSTSRPRLIQSAAVSEEYGRSVPLMRAVRGAGLVSAELAALVLLLRLDLPSVDWSNLTGWLDTVAAEDAVVALVRSAALVTAGYLLTATALYLVASLTRVPALIRGASILTLPSLRRVVDGAVAATILVAPASVVFGASPAAAQPAPTSAHAYSPAPAGDGAPVYEPTPAGGPTPARPMTTHVVRPGDSLWKIAAEHVGAVRGIGSEGEVAEVWRALVELNAPSLASGDPDLIYPGESIQLPPL